MKTATQPFVSRLTKTRNRILATSVKGIHFVSDQGQLYDVIPNTEGYGTCITPQYEDSDMYNEFYFATSGNDVCTFSGPEKDKPADHNERNLQAEVLAVSPFGNWMACVLHDNTFIFKNHPECDLVAGEDFMVNANTLRFIKRGHGLVAGDSRGNVTFFDLSKSYPPKRKRIWTKKSLQQYVDGGVFKIIPLDHLDHDEDAVLAATNKGVWIIHPYLPPFKLAFDFSNDIWDFDLSSDKKCVVAIDEDGDVQIYHLYKPAGIREMKLGHTSPFVCFDRENRNIYTQASVGGLYVTEIE